MSGPVGFTVPSGWLFVSRDALEDVVRCAWLYIQAAHERGETSEGHELLRVIHEFSNLVRSEEVSEVSTPVSLLHNVGAPPAQWLSAKCASAKFGVTPQMIGRRLRANPPTLIGGKFNGINYVDEHSMRERYPNATE